MVCAKIPIHTNSCPKLSDLSPENRYTIIKNAKLCVNCFESNHLVNACTSKFACQTCKKKHHTLLHRDVNNSVEAKLATFNAFVPDQVLLSTVIINIFDKNNMVHPSHVILDSGSQAHFISERLAKILNLSIENIQVPVVEIHQIQSTSNLKL